MKILILIIALSTIIFAQTDIRVNNEVVSVKLPDGTIILNEFIENCRIETMQQVIRGTNLNDMDTTDVPSLPAIGGLCEKNKLYGYQGQVIMCLQTHFRTIYPPEQTPALFAFYREPTGNLEWIPNELVDVNDIRWYQGIQYKCLQRHETLSGWEPPNVPALWQVVQTQTCPQWVQPHGAYDAYNIGDCVSFNGNCYESLINANVWSPSVYPAGWHQITCP